MDSTRNPQRRRRKRRVKEPLTDELLDELLSSPDPVKFADKHKITQRSLPDYLQQLLDEKALRRPDVIRDANLDATYGYQIFMGQRNASREKLLALVFALKCNLREANRVLRAGGHSELYVKTRRDAIIIFCIEHGYTLMHANQELFRFGEEAIS